MVQTAVADATMATPLNLYQVGEQLATAVTAVPPEDASALDARPVGDHALVIRRVEQVGPAESGWEYLAEGCAWVLDACD